jgi:hypothetical protein
MDKEQIRKLAENPKFIPGVYNYCDRWCEHCPFTSRCMNFALSEEEFSEPEARNINNKAFWGKMSEIFQFTIKMLREFAEQEDIDLDSLDLQQVEEEQRSIHKRAENHECARKAKVYGEMVDDWFNSVEALFEEKADELALKAQLELPDSDPAREAASVKCSVEVIRWHQHQIYVKLMRAVRGTLRATSASLDEACKDSDGSAKVALIGIERSISAWGQMLKYIPEREDNILDMLVHLERLRRDVEASFPDARSFVRPGFDGPELSGD